MSRIRTSVLALAASAFVLGACTNATTGERSNAQTGALIGAGLGGLFGLSRDGDAPQQRDLHVN